METLSNTQSGVDAIIAAVGKRLAVATPLGIGKPNHLLNALYRRAKSDASLELTVYTALTLERPKGKSELEQRFLGPLVERVFGNYPDLDYELDRVQGELPANVSAANGRMDYDVEPLLRRMNLAEPRSAKEHVYRRLIAAALRAI